MYPFIVIHDSGCQPRGLAYYLCIAYSEISGKLIQETHVDHWSEIVLGNDCYKEYVDWFMATGKPIDSLAQAIPE